MSLVRAREQHTEKVQSCSNTKITLYLVTSGGQNFNLYSNIIYFFNTNVN